MGEETTLAQVLQAKRSATRRPVDRRRAMASLMAGAAFVLLEELPSTEELAYGALAQASASVHRDLARLDGVDDVDLGIAVADHNR